MLISNVNNRKCHFTLSAPALKRVVNRRKSVYVCVGEKIYASQNAINMQIIKQKSHVSANARNECVYLRNNLSKASIFFKQGGGGGGRFVWKNNNKKLSHVFISGNCCLFINKFPSFLNCTATVLRTFLCFRWRSQTRKANEWGKIIQRRELKYLN